MRVGASMYVPMTRSMPVRAGGGVPTSIASPTAPTPAPVTAPSAVTSSTTLNTTFQAFSMKAQTFFSNIWDSLVRPFLDSIMGMFGMGN